MGGALFHPHAAPFRFAGSGDATAVLLHGWTGSPAHLRPLGSHLAAHGITAVAPLLAGHGTTPFDLARTTWRDWLRSAAEPVQEAAASGPVHVVGLSMGGLLSLLMAPTFGAASVTTINAPIEVWDRKARFAWLVRGGDGMRDRPPEEPPDPDVAEFYQHYSRSPTGTVADLVDLMRAARANLWRVRCPLLVIQSRADATVRPQSARIIHDGAASASKRLVWLEQARHVALVDPERAVIHREIVRHLTDAG